jgi:asparagine N-glycosylation enzyme membrane subunit Stt3
MQQLQAFLAGVYSLAWSGWWYVFDFIVGMIVIYLVYLLIKERKLTENGSLPALRWSRPTS